MIQKLSNIADQLREREQILPEVQLVSKALATLPENFRIVRTVWTSLPANNRTLDHLLQRLITEESVLKSYQKKEHNNDAAFTANNSRQDSTLVAEDLEENSVMGCKVVLWTNGHAAAIATAQPMKKRYVSKNGYPPNWALRKEDEVEAEVGATHPIHPTPYCLYQNWIQEAY
ncbi:hypothetical protein GHT06_015152 [Daphnia sinensis]|uniref:Uncharacterized protein n=1 Tax=Daphnia sinensis TaxID=1820382 RepID=A0AAD5KQS6_9CRUS|nr:hypothetical protein GHT06_015152 [Daphnia sinensis]